MLNHALDDLFFHLKVKEFWCDFFVCCLILSFEFLKKKPKPKFEISFSEINEFFVYVLECAMKVKPQHDREHLAICCLLCCNFKVPMSEVKIEVEVQNHY